MLCLIEIAEVRVHGVIIEVDVHVGIARGQPRVLNAHGVVTLAGRKFALLRLQHPVVAIIGDGADDFFFRDNGLGEFHVLHEPILRRHGAGCGAGIVLVVVHEHHAVGRRRDGRIVVFVAVRRYRDVELQAAHVQVAGQLLQERDIARLAAGRKGFEVDHQAAIMAGRQKLHGLPPEKCASVRVVQEPDNISYPVCAVGIVHHGEDFHGGIFGLEKRHHAVIDRKNRAALRVTLDDIEILIRLIVNALQPSIGGEHMQPVGIENVDLVGEGPQRRKTGRVPGNIEGSANSFFLIQLDLRCRQLRLAVRSGHNFLLAVAGLLFFTLLQGLEGALLWRE